MNLFNLSLFLIDSPITGNNNVRPVKTLESTDLEGDSTLTKTVKGVEEVPAGDDLYSAYYPDDISWNNLKSFTPTQSANGTWYTRPNKRFDERRTIEDLDHPENWVFSQWNKWFADSPGPDGPQMVNKITGKMRPASQAEMDKYGSGLKDASSASGNTRDVEKDYVKEFMKLFTPTDTNMGPAPTVGENKTDYSYEPTTIEGAVFGGVTPEQAHGLRLREQQLRAQAGQIYTKYGMDPNNWPEEAKMQFNQIDQELGRITFTLGQGTENVSVQSDKTQQEESSANERIDQALQRYWNTSPEEYAERWKRGTGGGQGPIKMMADRFGGGIGGYLTAVQTMMRDKAADMQELGSAYITRTQQGRGLTRKATDDILSNWNATASQAALSTFQAQEAFIEDELKNMSQAERDIFKRKTQNYWDALTKIYGTEAERNLKQAELSQNEIFKILGMKHENGMMALKLSTEAEFKKYDAETKAKLTTLVGKIDMAKMTSENEMRKEIMRLAKELKIDFVPYQMLIGIVSAFAGAAAHGLVGS